MDKSSLESDIVILGHIAKDIILIDGKSKIATGGAVYYGGIAGSHMGLKIIVITRLKKEDFPVLEEFKKHGVRYFAHPSKETSGLKNIYSSQNMEYRTCKPLGFAGLFKKDEIPDIKTRFFVLGPIITGEIDIPLLEHLADKYPDKICIDIQGFVRIRDKAEDKVFFQNLPLKEKELILSKVKILKVDHAEAEALTGKNDIRDATKILSTFGPSEILVTHEEGISVYAEDQLFFYPWKYRYIKGRTGRGDTAFISYVGSRITKSIDESLKFAVALTSLKLESPGPFTLPLYQVQSLLKEY